MSQRLLSGEPVSRVEIYVSCNKLKKKDVLSKSDPCCILFVQAGDHWREVARTENVKNSQDPQFTHPLEVDYFFEEVQKVRIDVYDLDNKSAKLADDDLLGSVEATLGEIVAGTPYSRPLILKGKAISSTITLRAQEQSRQQEVLHMTFQAQKLEKKDILGKSDPFLEFSRKIADDRWQVVYRTEVVKNSQNPAWRPIRVKASQLCGGDYDNKIRIDCKDYDSNGSHELIGSCETSVKELIQQGSGMQWSCVNPKKASKKGYQNSGVIILTLCEASKDATFLDYIAAGLQINVTIAIDFTGSNGKITSPESLHHVGGSHPNAYMRAIEAVGNVIQDYDSDKMYPVLGFGARVPPKMEVSHEFAVNMNATNPSCHGVKGILDAYKTCLSHIELFGPTNFAPVINHVAKFAAAAHLERAARNYFILLILTDGIVSDMQETLHAIVQASQLPMSIIIVGVGGSDFDAMTVLDGDGGGLQDPHTGAKARRDIVQFVAFRNCETPTVLAKHVLAEVPRQVCEYYNLYTIAPGTGVAKR
jgi:hypothetical protein